MTPWWAVIGTLAGVVITAAFSLATAYLTHRWQMERFDAEQRTAAGTALRAVRREVYMRYLVAVQSFYDKSDELYRQHCEQPIDPKEFRESNPKELQPVRAAYEAAKVDALLVADTGVRNAINAYDEAFGAVWARAASGTDQCLPESTDYYDDLVVAMHDEVVDLTGKGSGSEPKPPGRRPGGGRRWQTCRPARVHHARRRRHATDQLAALDLPTGPQPCRT
jgi:hypothetical protein